jgi:site-specific recombinase XerD
VPSPRRRGRPVGSFTRTADINDQLKSSDFYFLRAVIEKIDHKDAAERYLAQRGPMDRRTAVAYEKRLRARMQRAISLHKDSEEALDKFSHLSQKIEIAVLGPTLEDFAARFDDDMYSESELIELYKDEYGLQPGAAAGGNGSGATLKSKRQAIDWLRDRLSLIPTASEPTGIWIEIKVASALKGFGVLTLGELVDWINLTGRRWYEKVPGLGRNRSRRILVFLLQNEETIGKELNRRVRFTIDERYRLDADVKETGQLVTMPSALLARGTTQINGIVPLEFMFWPDHLKGENGTFRGNNPNTYGAANDIEAMNAWLKTLDEKSAATKDSYRRGVERLVLWALVERGVALSSLTTVDLGDFRDFLRNPPAHWCTKFPVMRHSEDWRPLRGPMGDASIQQTMGAISTFFSDLTTCGYLGANAAASIRSSRRRELRIDVMRSFSNEDLLVIRETLEAMPDEPNRRRLRAAILLLQTSGLRRHEAIGLTWGQIAPTRSGNDISETWAATFEGKGRKERIVPIQRGTLEALQRHLDDRNALIDSGHLLLDSLPKDDTSVLSVLTEKFRTTEISAGDNPSSVPRNASKSGALSAARLHGILKAFFKRCASHDGLVKGQANFSASSAHWLRHTFAHLSLQADHANLAAVQQILGHADIGTTGIYLKADLAARVAAVESVKGAV